MNKNQSEVHSYPCGRCEKSFGSAINWEMHMKSHAGKKLKECQQCDESFSNQSTLKKHISQIHKKRKTYSCDECSKSFSNKQSIDTHL